MKTWNSKIHGVVYTNKIEIGIQKLIEIEKKNNDRGIKATSRRFGCTGNVIEFDNGDIWRVMQINESSKGIRWNQALVDARNTTISMLHHIILPSGLGTGLDDITYFNW